MSATAYRCTAARCTCGACGTYGQGDREALLERLALEAAHRGKRLAATRALAELEDADRGASRYTTPPQDQEYTP